MHLFRQAVVHTAEGRTASLNVFLLQLSEPARLLPLREPL
jgi:hypothetical protein